VQNYFIKVQKYLEVVRLS